MINNHEIMEQIFKANPELAQKKASALWRTYPIDELVEIDFPPQQYIVDKLLTLNGIGIISGKPGVMKSFITVHIAICVATGMPVFNEFDTEKGNVLIIDLENNPARIKDRILALYKGKNVDRGIIYLFSNECPDFDITKEEDLTRLTEIVKTNNIKLVVLDSFIKIYRNKKEDSAVEMAVVFAQIRKIRSLGCSILIIHHHVKGGGMDDLDMMRGSGNIAAELDNQF